MKSFFYIKFHSSDYISYIEFVSVSYDRYFVNCFSYLNVLTRLCLFQLLNEVLLFLFCCNIWIGMPKNLILITNQRVRLGPCWQIYKQTLKKCFLFHLFSLRMVLPLLLVDTRVRLKSHVGLLFIYGLEYWTHNRMFFLECLPFFPLYNSLQTCHVLINFILYTWVNRSFSKKVWNFEPIMAANHMFK